MSTVIVLYMYLQDNGTKVVVHLLSGRKMVLEINDFGMDEDREDLHTLLKNRTGLDEHLPFQTEQGMFFLNKHGNYPDKELLRAIIHGYRIQTYQCTNLHRQNQELEHGTSEDSSNYVEKKVYFDI